MSEKKLNSGRIGIESDMQIVWQWRYNDVSLMML